jgi:predicted Zn finger-like uncharacterized protein
MIIQCPKCETQYRFDDTLIEGDGAWVRCSRCQHVFFQPRLADHLLGESPDIPSVRISDSKRGPDDRMHPGNGTLKKPDMEIPYSHPVSEGTLPERDPVVDFENNSFSAVPDSNVVLEDLSTLSRSDEPEDDLPGKIAKPLTRPKKRRRWGRIIIALIALLVFMAIVAGAVVLYLYPDIRSGVLKAASPYLRGIPVLENLVVQEKTEAKSSLEAVRIKNLRQRAVTNIISGNLQVVEGIAVNQADYQVSRIKVRLIITDPYDVVLGQKVAYCGNILTDEELGTMTDAEIQRELSIPQGNDFPGEHILPNGEIPFMIVFTQDQTAGAIKTSITVAGADRAL